MATAQELLDEVETAISSCLTAQASTARGRSLERARLSDLREFRRDLKKEIGNGTSMSSVGIIDRPT